MNWSSEVQWYSANNVFPCRSVISLFGVYFSPSESVGDDFTSLLPSNNGFFLHLKVEYRSSWSRCPSCLTFLYVLSSCSELDSTERELSERHSGIAGGEALHSSLPPSPPSFFIVFSLSDIVSTDPQNCQIRGQQPETVPYLPLQYYTFSITLCTCHDPNPGPSWFYSHSGQFGGKHFLNCWHMQY